MNEKILQRISKIIIEYATKQQVVEYNKISNELGGIISPIRLNEPLGEISKRCIQYGFPPLSAIVVNQNTRLPGEGFFTWVAAQMGFPNLPHSKWEEFYEEQEGKVFNCNDWDSFLIRGFSDNFSDNTSSGFASLQNSNLVDLLNTKEYLKGQQTKYYILTVKDFVETQQQGPYRYHVLVTENEKLIKQSMVEHKIKKQLLTSAKRKGIQLLLEIDMQIENDSVTMAHYKPDRQTTELWEKEKSTNLESLIKEERFQLLTNIVQKDIEIEAAQEDYYYRDGKNIEYYGTRYERNPINRAKAIEIHGITCKACGFDFKEIYGERGSGFIEVHHINPLFSMGKETDINPETDLVPLCSNCHRMIHRKKNSILTVEELKMLLKKKLTLASN
ncbi:HNH endonuclease [Rossellomorea aquimaris]|uniref:5-methylcytosine-specific restriction protein A n=1 Tax=Rossellomorea aquimaris TaxID=189382 RepID=A0A366ERB2_9BACI|nr:HNH endonuclease [Rossellomorea aquimaris]RBP04953.1 5-methylcytosine-specific restriction protein A [Rossellomorea aquimaris]